jgi:hypothetical protein
MIKMFMFSRANRAKREALDVGLKDVDFLISKGHEEAAFELLNKLAHEHPGNAVLTKQVYNLGKKLKRTVEFPTYSNIL